MIDFELGVKSTRYISATMLPELDFKSETNPHAEKWIHGFWT